VGANKHHGDHDANFAAAAAAAAAAADDDDDETNAKTRASRTELDQSKRKRDKPVTSTTSGSAKH
jgi:agmatine/peptidylarginine deiminase